MNASPILLNVLVDSVSALVSKIDVIDRLAVENDRISHNETRQLEDFIRKQRYFSKYWEVPYQVERLNSHSYTYDPRFLPTSGNVSFTTMDTMASANKALKKPKKNTWIMCPVCDPFKNACDPNCKNRDKKITINGRARKASNKSPIHGFYSTLNSSYVHHMAECHGAYGKELFNQPILGFLGTSLKFTIMCPYYHDDTKSPCLAVCDYSLKEGDGFKAYYRHVEHFHAKKGNPESKLGKSTTYYNPSDVFVPLSIHAFTSISEGRLENFVRVFMSDEAEKIIHNQLSNLKTTDRISLDLVYPASPDTFQLKPQQPLKEFDYVCAAREQHQYNQPFQQQQYQQQEPIPQQQYQSQMQYFPDDAPADFDYLAFLSTNSGVGSSNSISGCDISSPAESQEVSSAQMNHLEDIQGAIDNCDSLEKEYTYQQAQSRCVESKTCSGSEVSPLGFAPSTGLELTMADFEVPLPGSSYYYSSVVQSTCTTQGSIRDSHPVANEQFMVTDENEDEEEEQGSSSGSPASDPVDQYWAKIVDSMLDGGYPDVTDLGMTLDQELFGEDLADEKPSSKEPENLDAERYTIHLPDGPRTYVKQLQS